jgi:hypothetical protein
MSYTSENKNQPETTMHRMRVYANDCRAITMETTKPTTPTTAGVVVAQAIPLIPSSIPVTVTDACWRYDEHFVPSVSLTVGDIIVATPPPPQPQSASYSSSSSSRTNVVRMVMSPSSSYGYGIDVDEHRAEQCLFVVTKNKSASRVGKFGHVQYRIPLACMISRQPFGTRDAYAYPYATDHRSPHITTAPSLPL